MSQQAAEGTSRPGTNWNGHLPSNHMEREILNAIDSIEDEDGQVSNFMNPGTEPTKVHHRVGSTASGPKAVRADARASGMLKKMQVAADRVHLEEEMKATKAQVMVKNKTLSDSEEDDDDEAYQKFRIERLKQLQQQAAVTARLPTFGSLNVIDIDDFLHFVDHPGSDQTYVVVHLYEEPIALCVRMNFRLNELAKRYDQVRFLACSALACRPQTDMGTLPTLVVYQGGEYVADVQRVQVPFWWGGEGRGKGANWVG